MGGKPAPSTAAEPRPHPFQKKVTRSACPWGAAGLSQLFSPLRMDHAQAQRELFKTHEGLTQSDRLLKSDPCVCLTKSQAQEK